MRIMGVTFIGDYACKADSKWRVVVPSSFRKAMTVAGQAVFVLRRNMFDKCVDMYPLSEWERMVERLRERLNPFDAKHAAFLREFFRGTQEVEMDANGRVLLPRRVMEEAGIGKEMVMAAQDKVLQVWDAGKYEEVAMGAEELGRLAGEVFRTEG